MGLTEAAIRVAKPSAKPYKLTDGHGLYLLVNPGGSRLWRWRYAFGGREKLLALGIYPDTRLAEARELRDGHRASLRRGVDPSVERRLASSLTAAQQVQSFEAVAREWHARQLPIRTERHAGDVLDSLEKHVFPTLGETHVNAITPRLVLATLRTIEARPAIETAHRVRQRMSAVFVYAISCGVGETDPAAIVERCAFPDHQRQAAGPHRGRRVALHADQSRGRAGSSRDKGRAALSSADDPFGRANCVPRAGTNSPTSTAKNRFSGFPPLA